MKANYFYKFQFLICLVIYGLVGLK